MKAGAVYEQTILRESDDLSIVANLFNAPCVDSNGNSVPGFSDPSECLSAGYQSTRAICPCSRPMT